MQRADRTINSTAQISQPQRFGPWSFDPDTGNLESAETSTRLEPKVAAVLAYFLQHPDRVIGRDELIESVWAGRVVTDDAVHRCVSILRQTLTPDDTQAYIETITRRGYLAHFPPPEEPGTAAAPSRRAFRKWLWAVPVAVLLVVLAAWWIRSAERSEPVTNQPASAGTTTSPPLVAVLPFETSGNSADGGFFANGVHDDLITQLAQIQALRVISRTSVLEYRDSGKGVPEIARELGADAILEGSVQSVGDQIRINAQLIDADRDEHLWAQTYDRVLTPESLFTVQAEIARAVADALHARLTEQDVTELAILPTDNMAAYRAYHEAMQIRDATGVEDPAYLASLERAVELDPEFVRAWVELAGFLGFQYFSIGGDERLERVEEILDLVRSLAPGSADVLIAHAYYTYYVVRDYPAAYRLISEAQRLRPSDARLLDLKSWIARRLGDYDSKIDSTRLASRLDPRNVRWRITLVGSLVTAHRYEEAEAELDASAVEHPELAALRIVLDVRRHGDFSRWAQKRAALQREFTDTLDPLGHLQLWDALIAARQFNAAEALLRNRPQQSAFIEEGSAGSLSFMELHEVFTHWFLQREDLLSESLAHARSQLESSPRDNERRLGMDRLLVEAVLSAARGNAGETERFYVQWRQAAATDLAEYALQKHLACRALGMAGLAAQATQCLREALRKPSSALRFIEPELPYYEAIRDDPGFVGLQGSIRAAGNGARGP